MQTATDTTSPHNGIAAQSRSLTRVVAATMIGSAIEGFDFVAYGTAAALVFHKIFFPNFAPLAGTLAAFAAFAAGLFARPIGGVLFGHFGDRVGRKSMLTWSIVLMGTCTVLIGLLPTYGMIGLWAPVLLVVLRIGQGLSFGGENGGAILLAVEHAPVRLKTLFGSLPQTGAPIGLLLSSGSFGLLAFAMSETSFVAWGWRIPFLASAVLVAIGVYIRIKVDESPEFVDVKRHHKTRRLPSLELLAEHKRPLLLMIGGKLAEVTLFYTIAVFAISYATTRLGFSRGDALKALSIAAAIQLFTIPLFGWLGDRVGARRLYFLGAVLLAVMGVPIFMAIGSGSPLAYTVATISAMALNYAWMFGPQSNLYSAQLPAELRYSGISIGIQVAGAVGGGLAPFIATTLVAHYHSIVPVGVYISILALVAALSVMLMRSPTSEGH